MERTILRTLKLVHPHLMTTGTLWSEVVQEMPGANYTAFRTALHALEEKRQILCITGEDRDRAKITDEGIARLLE